MRISIGDKVRFLNEVGGGVVSRIEGDKLLYVLDEDGFEVPSLKSEVVLVERKGGSPIESQPSSTVEQTKDGYEFVESDEEGDPKLILACTKDENLAGNVKMYLINDSNFFAFYTIGRRNKEKISNVYNGLIEPNTKIQLDNLAINFVDGTEHVCQFLLYRDNKEYTLHNPVVTSFKLAGSKLLQDKNFTGNDYLEEKAMLTYLIKSTFEKKLDQLSTSDIKKILTEKEEKPKVKKQVRRDDKEILEVDLHIHELIDDTRGMSNKDMMEFQLGKFHEIMAANKDKKNRKIVFIHGKGNGVLKSELIKSLKKKYTWNSYQDASFEQYGFGATMVTI